MAEIKLDELGLRAGVWEALVTGTDQSPDVQVTHLGTELGDVSVIEHEKGWLLRVPVPADTLGDGVQTYLVTERETGTRLGSFSIATGSVLEDDVRAELDLLRAEVRMLSKAFRRLAADRE